MSSIFFIFFAWLPQAIDNNDNFIRIIKFAQPNNLFKSVRGLFENEHIFSGCIYNSREAILAYILLIKPG